MAVIFDFAEEILTGGGEYDGPSDHRYFQNLLDPDHAGETDWLEWDFKMRWEHVSGGGAETLSYKIQYAELDLSWVDLYSGVTPALAPGGSCIERKMGILEAAITMPIYFGIIATATNKWKLWYLQKGYDYSAFMRAVGSVS